LAVNVDSFGTGVVSDETLREIVLSVFDFRPAAIIERLDLRRPIYEPFACYGHFGRIELDPPWERTDMVEALQRTLSQRTGKVV
jgi:S-adenosylmethionine synthetase